GCTPADREFQRRYRRADLVARRSGRGPQAHTEYVPDLAERLGGAVTVLFAFLLALNFEAPPTFVAEKPQSAKQVARWKIEGAEDALVVVYYFGKGQGGSAEDNVKRWLSQFPGEDGEPKVEKEKSEAGLAVAVGDGGGSG